MQQLKKNILEEIINISTTEIDLKLYASYDNVEKIIEKYFEGFTKIIIENNLQEDFIEGLESLLKRELEVKEIEKLANSGILDECTDRMLETESEIIGEYYRANFKDHYKNQVLEMHKKQETQEEYQCSKCNRFFTEEDIFRFDSPCICNVCAQD